MFESYGREDAEEVIIAIPALGERKEMFLPLANKMDTYHWLVFDLPGSNQQQLDDYSIPTFCTYIKQTIDRLQITNVHFLGSSIGAWIIQAFTAKYPEYVRSLALLDGGHYFLGDRNEPYEDVELAAGIECFEDIEEAIKQLTYSMPNLEEQAYSNFENYFLNNYTKQGEFYAHHCNEVAYNSLSKESSSINYCLKEIDIPTILFIAEASADELSLKKSEDFEARFKQATRYLIENGQHYLPLTNMTVVANRLEGHYQVVANKMINSLLI